MPAVSRMLESVEDAGNEHQRDHDHICPPALPRAAKELGDKGPGEDKSRKYIGPGNQPGGKIGPLDDRRVEIGDVGQECGGVQRNGKCKQDRMYRVGE